MPPAAPAPTAVAEAVGWIGRTPPVAPMPPAAAVAVACCWTGWTAPVAPAPTAVAEAVGWIGRTPPVAPMPPAAAGVAGAPTGRTAAPAPIPVEAPTPGAPTGVCWTGWTAPG